MTHCSANVEYNPGFPSRSSSPEFVDIESSNLFQTAQQRPICPPQRAEAQVNHPYQTSHDCLRRLSFWNLTPDSDDHTSIFRDLYPLRPMVSLRSPNDFSEDMPLGPHRQNASQYDEQRFSNQYNEDLLSPMSMQMETLSFNPIGDGNWWLSSFTPSFINIRPENQFEREEESLSEFSDEEPLPEVTGEEEEEDIVIIERQSLYIHPDNFPIDYKFRDTMQRLGWNVTGIADFVMPKVVYATTTVGQEVKVIQRFPTKRENRQPCLKRMKNKKILVDAFKTNVLLYLLKFAINDRQVEIHFEALLKKVERKRIHRLVEVINTKSSLQFGLQQRILEEIRSRCPYKLSSQSYGEGEERKICVFKEAPSHMVLLTPDDLRPTKEEETNPFLVSIKKPIKNGSYTPSAWLNTMMGFFNLFSTEDYTEFRFLGPFNEEEVEVIEHFLSIMKLMSCPDAPRNETRILFDVIPCNEKYSNGFDFMRKVSSSTEINEDETKKSINQIQPTSLPCEPPRTIWQTQEIFNDGL